MKEIFIVIGITGEYGDSFEWPVIAYFDENKARDHVIRANDKAEEIKTKIDSESLSMVQKKELLESNEFDSNMSMDYTGTYYDYISVKIGD